MKTKYFFFSMWVEKKEGKKTIEKKGVADAFWLPYSLSFEAMADDLSFFSKVSILIFLFGYV